jgi:type II secretory pathway pseudopilin PulG
MNSNKGAMFGLDARIALAIFGALSVISGAALYSAIQNAKVTSILTELQEIAKAIEAHMLDVGQWPVQNSPAALPTVAQFYDLKLNSLNQSNSLAGWNGPYISGYINGSGIGIKKGDLNYGLFMNVVEDTGWGGSTPWWGSTDSFCTSGKSCALWISVYNFKDEAIAKLIDSEVDNSDGETKGRVKWYTNSGDTMLLYRINSIENPNR